MDRAQTGEHSLAVGRPWSRVERRTRTSRERLAWWMAAELAVDVVMLGLAWAGFDRIFSVSPQPPDPAVWHLIFSMLVIAMVAARGFYRPRLRLQTLDDLAVLAVASAAAAMTLITVRVLLDENPYTTWTVHYWLFAAGLLSVGRGGLHIVQANARRRGEAVRRTLIAGAGRMGHLVAHRLLDRPNLGLRPVGFIDKEPLDVGRDSVGLPVLGASWDLDRIIAEHEVEHVIVTFSTAPHHVLLALARRCRELGVSVSMVPRLYELGGRRVVVEHLGGVPLVSVDPADPRGWQFAVKYTVDRVIAGVLLTIMLPILLAVAVLIRFRMGSPVLYRQQRIGRDGRRFEMLKFRTMKGDPASEGEADADWAREQIGADPHDQWPSARPGASATRGDASADDRRTRLGRILRFFSLDELPQLLNVLRGEMSLVGPRPERANYVQRFESEIYRYRDRHRVKSGITGWAQVNGLRGKTSLADRVEWDNFYVENWSPWLDVKIVLLTIWCVVRGQHEKDPYEL
jgi:exopolysaccharide biosynthesis polyprenyl glycosylphosphotransferase